MNIKRFSRFPSILVLVASGAHAQGFCPPGQYPVSGQGWSYCAGVPDAQEASTTPAQTTKKWINKWLSLSIDKEKAILTTAVSTQSSDAAEALSTGDCERKGGTACKPRVTVLNGCLAMTVGNSQLASAVGATKQDAERVALERCSASDEGCRVYHSECALPEHAN